MIWRLSFFDVRNRIRSSQHTTAICSVTNIITFIIYKKFIGRYAFSFRLLLACIVSCCLLCVIDNFVDLLCFASCCCYITYYRFHGNGLIPFLVLSTSALFLIPLPVVSCSSSSSLFCGCNATASWIASCN